MDSRHHYQLIGEALHWLCRNQQRQPGLDELAAHIGLSPHYLQRLFQQWVGVTPKQYLKYLTKNQALERLRQGQTVFDTALDSGLSGPGRLHDLLITTEAMTPGEARRRGLGVDISYGFGFTPFGEALLAWNDRGICFLGFCHEKDRQFSLQELAGQWPDASLAKDAAGAANRLADIFNVQDRKQLHVWLRGTPFQLRVWEALLKIPPGTHCTYSQVAAFTGKPGANRAAGSAIGRNPVSWLIPCHRVINSLGKPTGYRWGITTKQAIIGYEAVIAAG
jgi:AraC family transcriptional regulator of adaptative response/methylated-DNA-[protein]-cysteine methyltransferase